MKLPFFCSAEIAGIRTALAAFGLAAACLCLPSAAFAQGAPPPAKKKPPQSVSQKAPAPVKSPAPVKAPAPAGAPAKANPQAPEGPDTGGEPEEAGWDETESLPPADFVYSQISAPLDMEGDDRQELAIFDIDGRLHLFGWNEEDEDMEEKWTSSLPLAETSPTHLLAAPGQGHDAQFLVMAEESGDVTLLAYKDFKIAKLCSPCMKLHGKADRTLLTVAPGSRKGRFIVHQIARDAFASEPVRLYDYEATQFKNGAYDRSVSYELALDGEPAALTTAFDARFPDLSTVVVSQNGRQLPRISRLSVSEEGVWEDTILASEAIPEQIVWAQGIKTGERDEERDGIAILGRSEPDDIFARGTNLRTLNVLKPEKNNLLKTAHKWRPSDAENFAAADLNGDGVTEIVGYTSTGDFSIYPQATFQAYVDEKPARLDGDVKPLVIGGKLYLPLEFFIAESQMPKASSADILPMVMIGPHAMKFDRREEMLTPAGSGLPKEPNIPLHLKGETYYIEAEEAQKALGFEMNYNVLLERVEIRFNETADK